MWIYCTMKPPRLWIVAAAGLALAALAALAIARHHERFSLGGIKDKAVGIGNAAKQGAVKGVDAGRDNFEYKPSYKGREWDGQDWSCPWWTVDTGMSNDKACISSQYHNPVWKWNGTKWGWACPNNTVDTGEDDWEKKCEVGWTHRVLMDGRWQCPPGTEDSGRTWDNSSWRDAQKQCRVNRAFTLRMKNGAKYECPPNTKDTGRDWGQPGEYNQCKFIGG